VQKGAQAAVLKTAKAAKLFETQRLIKKLKQARYASPFLRDEKRILTGVMQDQAA
jgi:hypothetical protein